MMNTLIEKWRNFCNENDPRMDNSRVGGTETPLTEILGLFTLIKDDTNTIYKRTLTASQKNHDEYCERLHITSDIKYRSESLFMSEPRKGNCADKNAIISACLYIACKEQKIPRTINEIIGATICRKKDLALCYKQIIINNTNMIRYETKPWDLIPRFCGKLGLS